MFLFSSSVHAEEANHPEWAPELLGRVTKRIGSVIVGHEEQISLTMIALLAGGHVLLEDVPGVGKTMLVKSVASLIGRDFSRIQFTYDLMPGDITGASVYYPHTGEFVFRPGPVMSNIVLADEINRASPRAQSAPLEAMEEGASPWTAIRIRRLPRSSCWQRKIRTNMKAQAACRRRLDRF